MYRLNPIISAMLERRSVRAYQAEMVPKEMIEQIVLAGTYAASSMGQQATAIVAITNQELRNQLATMNAKIGGWQPDFDPFYGAPVILLVLAEKNKANRVYDGSLVMGNLMLAASALGLGSCWIHRAKEEIESVEGQEILKKIGIEGNYEGIGHCVIGFPKEEIPEAAPRNHHRVFYAE